jgi:hypothetical protein
MDGTPARARRRGCDVAAGYATLFALAAPFSSICEDPPHAYLRLVPRIQVEGDALWAKRKSCNR